MTDTEYRAQREEELQSYYRRTGGMMAALGLAHSAMKRALETRPDDHFLQGLLSGSVASIEREFPDCVIKERT